MQHCFVFCHGTLDMVIWASIPDECYRCFLVVAIVTVVIIIVLLLLCLLLLPLVSSLALSLPCKVCEAMLGMPRWMIGKAETI